MGRAMALCTEMTQPLGSTWQAWRADPAVGMDFAASTAQVLLLDSRHTPQKEDKQYC